MIFNKIKKILSLCISGIFIISQNVYSLSPKTFSKELINNLGNLDYKKDISIVSQGDSDVKSLQDNLDYNISLARKKISAIIEQKDISKLEAIILEEWEKNKIERNWVLLIEAVTGLNILGKSKNKFIRQNFQFIPTIKLSHLDFNEIRKEFLFWFARNPENRNKNRDYSSYEKTYKAVIAIPKKYRTVKILSKLYENGGDKELLLACKKFNIVVEYPDKESALLALLDRKINERTAKVLKYSIERGGDQRLLEAIRIYKIPLPNDKLVHKLYKSAEDTLEAILELPNELRSKSKLKKHNYPLYRAYHDKFEDEIRQRFKYEVPVEKGPKYPDAESTLLGILKRDPLRRNITSMLEDGEEALIKSFYLFKDELKEKFNYILPRWSKYSTIEEVLNDLLAIPIHLRTAKMLNRPENELGNRALLQASRDFKIKLPKEYVGEYKTGDDVLIALLKIPEYERTAFLLNRKKEEGGNPGLLSAYYAKFHQQTSKSYGFELTKGTKEKYQTYDEAYYILRARPKEHQSYSALKGASRYGIEISDTGLLNACKRFNIPLYNDVTKSIGSKSYRYLESLYPTPKSVYDAIMALPVEQRSRGFLRKPKEDGGNRALHKQYLNFEDEIRKQFNYILPKYLNEPLYRYHRDIALLGLLLLPLEQRTATKLEKISKSLLRACRDFNIPLPEERRGLYNSAEDVLRAILKKPPEERNITFLQKKVEEGGDPNLVRAYYDYRKEIQDIYNYSIPDKIFAKYPDTESLFIALLSIPKDERNHWHLDRKDEDNGNRTLLSTYYANRKNLLREFNFEMENPKNLYYPTVMSWLKDFFKLPKEERTIDALERSSYSDFQKRLLKGAKFHDIKLYRTSKRAYPDAETTLKAILSIPDEERKLTLFPSNLRYSYYEFKDEIKENFNYEVPHMDTSKYQNKEDAIKALNEIDIDKQTFVGLIKLGKFALISACKKFNIPLRKKVKVKKVKVKKVKKEEYETSYYEKFRKKVLSDFNLNKKIDVPLELWKKMKDVNSSESKEARDMLFGYFIYFALQQAEKLILKRPYDDIRVTENSASMIGDLIGSSSEAIANAIDSWQPKSENEAEDNTFEIHVLKEIESAIKAEHKNIFADYWRTVSISKPSGNKGGDNFVSVKGQFGSTNSRTLEDRLEDESVSKPEEAIERFEKMMSVLDGIKTGDYGFFEEAGFEFDDSLVFSQEQKLDFMKDLKKYFELKGIVNKIKGNFGIWVMGSMGRIGLARKGLSDVNLLLISSNPENELHDIIIELKRAIGSGIIEKSNDGHYVLTIGKHESYIDMLSNSKDLLNIIDKHNLGDLENGIASIEVVSLDKLANPDNKALNRAHFHISENIYEMGANGQLLIESETGFSKIVSEIFENRVKQGDLDYLFFMNNYLSSFLQKQVLKVINAHKYVNKNVNKKSNDIMTQENIDDSSFEYVEYFLDDSLRAGVINGSVSLAFRSVLKDGISISQNTLKNILKKFNGKVITIDDPLIDETKYPEEYLRADEQTNILYEKLDSLVDETMIDEDSENENKNIERKEDLTEFLSFYKAYEGFSKSGDLQSQIQLNNSVNISS